MTSDMTEKKTCGTCKHFRELVRPFEREDGATIFGYCFKNAKNNYSPNMGKGYPVFLPPDAAGACKDYKKDRSDSRQAPGSST